MDLTDTTTWLPLDQLAPGFDAGKGPPSAALSGRDVDIAFDDGGRATYHFHDATTLSRGGPGDRAPAGSERGQGAPGDAVPPATTLSRGATVAYEALEAAPELYLVVSQPGEPRSALALVLDLRAGRALEVTTRVGAVTPGRPACSQAFRAGVVAGAEVSGEPPAPTLDLVGRRVLWVYSSEHAYEHVYLSGHWYTWQCLAGPERGLADTDPCTVWRVRPEVYAVTWREKVVPCAATVVCDYGAMRSHGMLFGLESSRRDAVLFTFGAHGRVLSDTRHPEPYDPRTIPASRA